MFQLKSSIFFLLFVFSNISFANDYDDILSVAKANALNHESILKDAGEILAPGDVERETTAFESNIDNQDNSGFDVLKESLNKENEKLKDIHEFFNKSEDGLVRSAISESDPLLSVGENVSSVTGNKIVISKKLEKVSFSESEPNTFICESSLLPKEKLCTVKRVVTPKEQEDTVEIISAHVAGVAYASSTFSINLITGEISGANALASISATIGDRLDKITSGPVLASSSLSSSYFTESVTHSLIQQPTKSNGYIAVISVTGNDLTTCSWRKSRKAACENRRNRARGVKYSWTVTYKSSPLFESDFVDDCKSIENDTVDGGCYHESTVDNEVNAIKEVSGHSVSMPFWSQTKKYICGGGDGADTCDSAPKDCTFSKSECTEKRGRFCIKERKTFNCEKLTVLDGDSEDVSAELSFDLKEVKDDVYDSLDFAEASTALNVVNGLPSNFDGYDLENPSLFKGEEKSCNIVVGSDVQNCCAFKGILKGVIGGGCPSEVTSVLAPAVVRENRCHLAQNRICTKKVLKKCVRWTKRYCCYQDKLARIIQEIAHQQLSIPWNSCDPVTPDIIKSLDFDTPYAKLKLQELVGENLSNLPNIKSQMSARLSAKFDEIKGRDCE